MLLRISCLGPRNAIRSTETTRVHQPAGRLQIAALKDCNSLAAHPWDTTRPTGVIGVEFDQINATQAILSCRAVAADAGSGAAMNSLGFMYAKGVGVPPRYLANKLAQALPTTDSGVLRTIGDAVTYMTALGKARELAADLAACTLILNRAPVLTISLVKGQRHRKCFRRRQGFGERDALFH
jgi:hypothetical protein